MWLSAALPPLPHQKIVPSAVSDFAIISADFSIFLESNSNVSSMTFCVD